MKNLTLLIRKITIIVTGLITAIFLIGINTAEPVNERIAVIMGQKASPFEEALSGFQEYLQKKAIQVNYDIYRLEGDMANANGIIQKVKKTKVNLIFTLGSLATETTINEVSNIPIVAGMILREDLLKKTPNGTGVFLEFPVETQLKWLQRLLPDTKTVGVIFNPQENNERMESASRVASKMGLKLEAYKVNVPQDLPEALNRLAKNADVFWGVPDNLVLNPQTAKHILLFSFQNRIPFIGLSSAWVKAGALYSLDWDYIDIGKQCGEIADKIFQGIPMDSIPLATPRKVMYVLNLNAANQMKIKIPEEIIRGAHQTF